MVIKLLKKKSQISKLSLLLLVLFIIGINSTIFENFNTISNEKLQIDDEIKLKELEISAIYNDTTIDALLTSNTTDEGNWTWARTQPWCTSGLGTQSDPYIIEVATFSYSSGTGDCLRIFHSRKYFIIRNCTFKDALDNGLYLYNVTNGQIINNEIYGNLRGVELSNSNDTLISDNQVYNNNYGFYLGNASDNRFANNMLNGNSADGIHMSYCTDNIIVNNILNGSSSDGVYARNSDNNNITGNIITNNGNGTRITVDCDYNLIYNNSISSFGNNGIDMGSNNDWNSTLIGNYWDDYSGVDESPKDGIGDSSYNIGPAGSKDYLPIYENPVHNGSTIHIDGNGINALNWSKTALVKWWCFGSGTYSKPYIIKELTINGENSSNCLIVENSNVFFRIEDCTLFNSSSDNAGIELKNVFNGQLINNNCTNNNGNGIILLQSQDNIITKNTLNVNEEFGLRLSVSYKNTISNNTANDNSNGMYLGLSNNNNISENTANGNEWCGIYLSSSSNNNSIIKNTAINNSDDGIYVSSSYNNTVMGNQVENNRMSGINIWKSNNTRILENTAISNSDDGIVAMLSYNTTIMGNQVENNRMSGINIWKSNNTHISENTVKSNDYFGVALYNNSFNIISENTLSSNRKGIRLSSVNDSEISNNIANINIDIGIDIENSNNNLISENTVNHNLYSGLHLSNSNNNTISRNIAINNTYFGIAILNSSNNIVSENTASNNNNTGIRLWFSDYNTIKENSVNNNSIYGISLTNSSNNLIAYNNETINYNGLYGIYLIYSNFNNITKNVINYNGIYGIYLLESNYNYITENTLIGNKEKAIKEENCEGNIIKNNKIDGKGKFQLPLELIILFSVIGAVAIVVSAGAIVYKKKVSRPKKDRVVKLKVKKEEIEEKEKLKKERKEETEKLRLEKQKKKIENKLHKRMKFVDSLIKENNLKKALEKLTEIENIAKTHGLVDFVSESEQKKIECKKRELDIIRQIKQTVLNLGGKYPRLQLMDISEKCSIKDETLIEGVIQEMIKNKEIQGDYFSASKSLVLEVVAPISALAVEKKFNVFLSYSTLDADYFEISRIVKRLELYPEISKVYFWEADSGENIVTFMEQTLKKINIFVLFCTENSIKSKAVEDEWQAAFQLRKEGLMRMVPVYEKDEHIPYLLKPILNVKFIKDDFDGFIENLYKEILR